MPISSRSLRRYAAAFVAAASIAGCGGNSVTLPRSPGGGSPRATSTPSHAATSTPTPAPTATSVAVGGVPSAAQMVSALNDAQTYFTSLPATGTDAELAATASHMVSSGNFIAAVVGIGGITGTFKGGVQAMLFADRPEEQDGGYAAMARTVASATTTRMTGISGASTTHEIVYFINTTDKSGAFVPARQVDFAAAWPKAYGDANAATYESDDVPVSLENIIALGRNHPIDFLSLATHGLVAYVGATQTPQYINLSDTFISTASTATYAAQITGGSIFPAAVLRRGSSAQTLPTLAFTPAFLTANLTFNPGAYFDNQSCHGQNTKVAAGVLATLTAAGIAMYSGWTFAVDGTHADQSDAFLEDRLLGEPSAALAAYVGQRSPQQRPFALTDVLAAMATETRYGGLITSPKTYTYSPNGTPNPAMFVTTGSGMLTDAITVPSIASMAVSEAAPVSTIAIPGSFSAAKGTVMLGTGTSAVPLAVDSWTTAKIVAELPASGGGTITVVTPTGLQSPPVALTYWHGHLVYKESATTQDFGGATGSGTGALTLSLDIGIRSDVAPVVPTVDVSPVPQNLYVSDVTPNSFGKLTGYQASFASSDGTQTASITPAPSTLTLVPYATSDDIQLSSSLSPAGGAPTCNNAMPGPATSGSSNIACPAFAYAASNAGTCSDNQNGSLCAQSIANGSKIDNPSSHFGDDQDYDQMPSAITLTMDPNTYALSFNATPGTTYTSSYADFGQVKETFSGYFDAPVASPMRTAARTPVERRR